MMRFAIVGALLVAACGPAAAHDAAAGQAKFDAICSQCHAKADFAKLDGPAIEAKLNDFVKGKQKHKKKLKLSDGDIMNLSAYLKAP